MKTKILRVLAVGLIAAPIAAMASPVTWNFTGTWTNMDGSAQPGFSPLPAIGDAFGISLTFDSSAASLGSCDGDPAHVNECQAYSGASLLFVLNSPSCAGGDCTSVGPDPGFDRSRMFVINDAAGAGGDGLTFRLYDANGNLWRLFLQSEDKNVFGGTDLPTAFDPRLLFFNQFTVCDPKSPATGCPDGTFTTRATGFETLAYVPESGTVPEPGTLALLGLGLAGFGLSRRRKA